MARVVPVTGGNNENVKRNTNKNLLTTSEADFTTQVVNILHLYGWLVYHPLPATNQRGRWITATQGDAGWPDIAAAHPVHGFLLAELKSDKGTVKEHQKVWLKTLLQAGVETYVWRPDDLEFIIDRAQGIEMDDQ